MGECTVVLVGGNNGGKENLLQELLGRRQGGAWCYSYRHITYDLRLLPLCALQSPALRGADCTVLVTPALDLQRALAALPALWQRSHRLVVYITDRGAARRRGVIVCRAGVPGGGGHPLQQPWGQSAAGCGGPGGTFSAGAPYPGGYAYPNGTGGSGAPGESCAHIPSVPGVDGGAVRDPVGVGCFALGVAIAFWQGIERFSVLYLRENRSPDILC